MLFKLRGGYGIKINGIEYLGPCDVNVPDDIYKVNQWKFDPIKKEEPKPEPEVDETEVDPELLNENEAIPDIASNRAMKPEGLKRRRRK